MRFCPFCSAENADETAACQSCGRRLPPLPPRRAGTRVPPPPLPARKPPPLQAHPPASAAQSSATVDDTWGGNESGGAAALRNAIAPAPAAERRPPAPAETRTVSEPARRKNDERPKSSSQQPVPGASALPSAASSSVMPTAVERPAIERTAAAPPLADRSERSSSSLSSQDAFGLSPGSSGSMPVSRPKTPSAPPPLPAPRDSASGPVHVSRMRTPTGLEPPPTRIQRPEALVDRPFAPPKVRRIPELPEPGPFKAARYTYEFGVARWQRRGAIKQLGLEIKQDTEALDQVLGALGRAARGARVEGRVFSAENAAITSAEQRVTQLTQDTGEVEARKADENSKFGDVERERNEKLVDAERMVEEGQRELQHLEAQRRSLRDKRKELERRQRTFLKSADDNDRQAGSAPLGDQRQELRRVAEGHRREAAALEPEKQDIDRRLTSHERPISEAVARLDAAKAELDAAKRSLSDAREGHTHRLAELDAEQKRKGREIGLAEAEIQRRLVTLGTLVNLNRIEDTTFSELYQRIDRLRGAITARTTEIEKLTAEREAYDRGTLVRGLATIAGVFVLLIALFVILRAVL